MRGVRRETAALGLLLLAVGCSSGSTPALSPTPAGTSATPSATVSATPHPTATRPGGATSTPATGPTPKPGSTDFGYVVGVSSTSPLAVRFDRAEFLTGAAADKAAAARGQETPVPNDYFIVNDNPRLRVLRVANGCVVRGSLQLTGFVDPDHATVELTRVPLADWVRFVRTKTGQQTPFHLTYGAEGVVSRIDEQYVP